MSAGLGVVFLCVCLGFAFCVFFYFFRVVSFCCVRFSYFRTELRDWLERTSSKWPILEEKIDDAVGWWLGGVVVRALHLQLDGCEFDSQPPQLILGWLAVFGWANQFSISLSHPDQLNLLPSVGREMSTSRSAVMLCGCPGVKWLIPLVDKRVGGR